MLRTTERAIAGAVRSILETDPTMTADERREMAEKLAAVSRHGGDVPMIRDRAISRREAAQMLGVKPHTVSTYARRGLIKAFRFGKKGRLASGYSAASVAALLADRGEIGKGGWKHEHDA